MKRLVLLAALSATLAGCGSSGGPAADSGSTTQVTATETVTVPATTSQATTSESTTAGTTTSASPVGLTLFFLRDGRVAAAHRDIPATQAVGAAALRELAAGPSADELAAGLTSEVPSSGDFSLSIQNGTAVVVGPEGLSDPAAAQIVYTLTQFPTVKVVRLNGGNAGDRTNWEKLTPPILVLTPTPGQTVTSPLHVAGTANTFEATLQLELQDSAGTVLAHQTVTATSGSGTRGTFDVEVPFTASGGDGTLVAYEDSAENGKRIHVVAVPLHFG